MLAPTTHASARARPVRCLLAAALFGLAWLLTLRRPRPVRPQPCWSRAAAILG